MNSVLIGARYGDKSFMAEIAWLHELRTCKAELEVQNSLCRLFKSSQAFSSRSQECANYRFRDHKALQK